MLVFVYGTLRQGEYNNRILAASDAKYVAHTQTKADDFAMYHLGSYPCVVQREAAGRIMGEIYEVPNLYRLDALEGYPRHYDRIEVELSTGHVAWMYVYRETPKHCRLIPSGDWKDVNATT